MRQGAMRSEGRVEWLLPRPAPEPAVVELEPRRRDRAAWYLLRFVALARGVGTRQLLSPSRGEADVALARQLAMYLMHVVLGRLYLDIGRFYGRDRTTVSYACALIEDMRDDPEFDAEVSRLERRLTMRREVRHARA
jgi:chromosomal replication initiation ATPase DnaA